MLKMAESYQISRKLGSGRDLTKEEDRHILHQKHGELSEFCQPVAVLNQQMSCSDTSCPSKTCLKARRPCPLSLAVSLPVLPFWVIIHSLTSMNLELNV